MANKKKDLKNLSANDLSKTLESLGESLRLLRFKSEGSKSKNVKEAWSLRKQMARVLTMINKNQ